jgi:hypothetical protein
MKERVDEMMDQIGNLLDIHPRNGRKKMHRQRRCRTWIIARSMDRGEGQSRMWMLVQAMPRGAVGTGLTELSSEEAAASQIEDQRQVLEPVPEHGRGEGGNHS